MQWIKEDSLIIEYLAVAIIVGMVAYSTALYFLFPITKGNTGTELGEHSK